MVKSFCRSAAGISMNKPSLLRPPQILIDTITYLIKEILPQNDVSFIQIYDFINDRLQSVRQDATIQQVSDIEWLIILPPIVRFYAYSAYRCYKYDLNHFDPFLNKKNFDECILKILKILVNDNKESSVDNLCSEMVSLLVVANLGNYHILQQVLPFITKKHNLIHKAVMLSLNIMNGYFGKITKFFDQFPILHLCIIAVQLPGFRQQILKAISISYNSKNNYLPINFLKKLMLHNNEEETKNECHHYGLKIINDKVEVTKTLLKTDVKEVQCLKELKFDENICSIILNA
ncbi:germinal-center associated nuclear protein-like isoform X2 [Daktulosphaira vitifoliae]|nr:germinal-center associated nuclear protein-like isoform X2 [Daktulosphaira vitifoliae]